MDGKGSWVRSKSEFKVFALVPKILLTRSLFFALHENRLVHVGGGLDADVAILKWLDDSHFSHVCEAAHCVSVGRGESSR